MATVRPFETFGTKIGGRKNDIGRIRKYIKGEDFKTRTYGKHVLYLYDVVGPVAMDVLRRESDDGICNRYSRRHNRCTANVYRYWLLRRSLFNGR